MPATYFNWSNVLSLEWWSIYLVDFYHREPAHLIIEVLAISIILYLLFSPQYNPNEHATLSKKEEDALIEDWTPEALIPTDVKKGDAQADEEEGAPLILENGVGPIAIVEGKEYLNMASNNFAGLANCKIVKDAAAKVITEYGVGSCGPRGFYGTIDVHLQLERTFARFMGVEDSILYSDGIACMASVIPAFAKSGDLLICDAGINNAIQMGNKLSRSNVMYFKHNDADDLERLLGTLAEKDLKRSKLHRKFIVIEGVYQYSGDIAPLPKILALARKYKYRVIMDDSLGVGVLGATGRGTTEHYGFQPKDVDIIGITLDAAFGSVGGLCIGSKQIVDHQRLSGAGYCFSAASPPYTAEAGAVAIALIDANPNICRSIREKATAFRAAVATIPGISVADAAGSPIVHVRLANPSAYARSPKQILKTATEVLRTNHGVIAIVPSFIPTEKTPPPASLRFNVTVEHADADLKAAAEAVRATFAKVLAAEPKAGAAATTSSADCALSSVSSSTSTAAAAAAAAAESDDEGKDASRRRRTRSQSRKL